METSTVTQVNYSLKEKYFRIEPEMRIRRYQYFVRVLMPGILFFLASMLLIAPIGGLILVATFAGWWKAAIMGLIIGSSALSFFFSFLIYKIGLNLVTKRCHDFGSDGKIARVIVSAIFIVNVALIFISLLSHLVSAPDLSSIFDTISINATMISNIVSIPAFIMWIILLFRPGASGDNTYGKDPINTKISFLG